MPFKVEAIHAFIAVDPKDPKGDEGICGFVGEHDRWIPMIAADKTRLDQLRPVAESISRDMGVKITLVRFSQRTDLEVIGN